MAEFYNANPNLKNRDVAIPYTPEQLQELVKCKDDPIYFINNYVKIINLDKGLVPFNLFPYQERMVKTLHDNRFVIGKCPRQCGKTVTVVSYLLHQIIFNPDFTVAILANKEKTAREILSRLKLAYEHLPKWLQLGVIEWNKSSIVLENNSKVLAYATSSDAIRGMSINILMLDEFAFLPNSISHQFMTSVYPTVQSGTNTKIFIVSTPNGMNLFKAIWDLAVSGMNQYAPFSIHWSDWPGHDEDWKEKTIANMGADGAKKFQQEYECEFLGSANTLIADTKLAEMIPQNPIFSSEGLDVYHRAEDGHTYIACVDISKGVGEDFHAIVVVDVTSIPYKLAAKWRNNVISPLLVPDVVFRIASSYNDAFVLIEVNNNGGDVARALQEDLEYENLLMTTRKPGLGQTIGGGFGSSVKYGVDMDKLVKRSGCNNLKILIESDKLFIYDHDIIEELKSFIAIGSSYRAQSGNDDLVMCLVSFSWLVSQRYFKELMDQDIQAVLREEQNKLIEEDLLPFGFIEDGIPKPPPNEPFYI